LKTITVTEAPRTVAADASAAYNQANPKLA
jgi:hypothetical protein